jgi:hypothetical protein
VLVVLFGFVAFVRFVELFVQLSQLELVVEPA